MDDASDLSCKDDIGYVALDGWEPTHNRAADMV
jgi:hypothetical protein